MMNHLIDFYWSWYGILFKIFVEYKMPWSSFVHCMSLMLLSNNLFPFITHVYCVKFRINRHCFLIFFMVAFPWFYSSASNANDVPSVSNQSWCQSSQEKKWMCLWDICHHHYGKFKICTKEVIVFGTKLINLFIPRLLNG